MIEDPIVEEIRHYRQEHAAWYGNDLAEICKALRELETRSKRKVINRGPRGLLGKHR